jgi:tetratricopeptide (TPR) repeat protein
MNNNICKSAILNGGRISPLIIPHSLSGGLGLTNPSILKIDGKIMLNIRHVQYALYHSEKHQRHQSPHGCLSYLNPEDDITLTTVNYICELDLKSNEIKNINKVDTSKLDVKPKWEFVGLEDARLVNWDDNLILTGVRRDTTPNGVGRMELSKIKKNKEISRVRIEPPIETYCEKNWMPILDKPNHYVKWCNPTEVVEINPKTKSSKTVNLVKQNIDLPRDLRGGSQVIKYKNYWVAITHEVDLWFGEQGGKDAQYYHRFIVWDKDWNIVYHSEDFKFMDARIEFSCGLHIEGDKFLIPFGFQDTTAFLLELPITEFEKMVGMSDSKSKSKIVTKPLKGDLNNYVLNPEDAQFNYNLGLNYFNQEQYASALSFFLRAAELEPITNENTKSNLTYESLLFVAKCLQNLGRRAGTELALWNNALRYDPTRPEAYLFLSQYYEVRNQFSEAQSFARIGLEFKDNHIALNNNLNYHHYYQLKFQDALCDWNLGQGDSARAKFRDLGMGNYPLDKNYVDLVQINMTSLGSSGDPFLPYNKSMSENLRYKFHGYDNINFNFSQTFQDMFTLSMLDGLKNGNYLEIGAADPYKGSNTALLEDLGWSGISLEILDYEVEKFRKVRRNPVVLCNALEYDYSTLPKVVDYLQVDCEPPAITYEIMTKLPFDKTDFKVITYEHDFYTDLTGKYRQLSRDFLTSKGYLLVAANIAPDLTSAYEDWWVKPEYIDAEILEIMLDKSDETKNAKTYMLSRSYVKNDPQNIGKIVDFSNAKFVARKK